MIKQDSYKNISLKPFTQTGSTPVLQLGKSGTAKTERLETLAKRHSAIKFYVINNQDKDRWKGKNIINCRAFDKKEGSELIKYAKKWLLPRAKGNVVVFEDLPDYFGFKKKTFKAQLISMMCQRVRNGLIMNVQPPITDQLLSAIGFCKKWVISYCDENLLSNIQKIFGSRSLLNDIKMKCATLEHTHKYFLLNSGRYTIDSFDSIEPLEQFLISGLESFESKLPEEKTPKKNQPRVERETRYVQICKMFAANPSLTWVEVADKLGLALGTMGPLQKRMKRKGLLPKMPKKKWTKKTFQKILYQVSYCE